jgi:hypothetical protein
VKPEEYLERTDEIDGWPVTIISYKLGDQYHAKVENNFTRGWTTREQAQQRAIDEARVELARTRRLPLT